MCAEVYSVGEPYRLSGHRIVFTNWYYVRPGTFGWYDEKGQCVTVRGAQGPLEARMKSFDCPWGIRLSVKNALRSGPILKAERPWEEGGAAIITIIKEGSLYRAWGNTGWGDLKERGERYFCYFESKDGIHWERPNCGVVEYGGNRNNNLLDNKGGTVFIDPSAPVSERYKWISIDHFTREEYEEYCQRRPDAVDPRYRITDKYFLGVRGAVSPDGIHWTILPEPLVMMYSDTQIVAYYDTFLKKYVAYFRDWMIGKQREEATDDTPEEKAIKWQRWISIGRRAIGRGETSDFRNFPLSELIVEPSPEWPPYQVLYTNCKTTIPGAPDHHLMFPAVWDTADDTTHIRVLSSHDGKIWNYIPGAPILVTASFGEWDGGCVFASPNLIELPNGDFALPYNGFNVPHKYPRRRARRACGYALWPKGRLVALEAPEKGEFSTVAVIPPGDKLLINAVTKRAGYILVEAADLAGKPIPGREFENAVPIFGDQHKTLVVWKGHNNLGIEAGEGVILRFKLEKASIYALEFEK